jgi:hypothetical protein
VTCPHAQTRCHGPGEGGIAGRNAFSACEQIAGNNAGVKVVLHESVGKALNGNSARVHEHSGCQRDRDRPKHVGGAFCGTASNAPYPFWACDKAHHPTKRKVRCVFFVKTPRTRAV